MSSSFEAVLLIGFGGPTRPEEIRPFLANAAAGRNIPESRLREVEHHYEQIGGKSPYNEITLRQLEALKQYAEKQGFSLPFYLGMRNWTPYLKETLFQMKKDGIRRTIGFVLAPHRSYSSFNQYLENVETAKSASGFEDLEICYAGPWFDHPLYIEAVSERVGEVRNDGLIFTAHSIPLAMAQKSQYQREFETSSRLVADRLGARQWKLAYQSRSGRPQDPWLEPDVNEVIREAARDSVQNVKIVPIGFLADHAEVLYDLDFEARQTAESCGIGFYRAKTVMDHPKFIQMMFEMVRGVCKL